METLLGDTSYFRLAGLVLGVIALTCLVTFLLIFTRPKFVPTIESRYFSLICQRLRSVGLESHAGEAPLSFFTRCREHLGGQAEFDDLTASYTQVFYAGNTEKLSKLKRCIKNIKPKRPK